MIIHSSWSGQFLDSLLANLLPPFSGGGRTEAIQVTFHNRIVIIEFENIEAARAAAAERDGAGMRLRPSNRGDLKKAFITLREMARSAMTTDDEEYATPLTG